MELDPKARKILGSEHNHNEWIGPKLLSVANYCRYAGARYDDYEKWVKASHLWLTYEESSSSTVTERERIFERAWEKSYKKHSFELDDSLERVRARVRAAKWLGRSGSRDRAVALAFIDFCQEHNCFTRTISSYELAKWTPGFSASSVQRALANLIGRRVLLDVPRTDAKLTARSTRQYQLNLEWRDAVSEAISLPAELIASSPSSSLLTHDLWSNRGLGQSPGRVFEVLDSDFLTVKEISSRAQLPEHAVRRAVGKLYEVGLAMKRGKRPVSYCKVDGVDLDLIAEAIGVTGAIGDNVDKLVARQNANYVYKQTFRRPAERVST